MVYEFVEGEVVLAFPVLFKFTEALLVEFEVIVVSKIKVFASSSLLLLLLFSPQWPLGDNIFLINNKSDEII